MRTLSILLALIISSQIFGQNFISIDTQMDVFHTFTGVEYGCGASFYDVDHDGWDDLTTIDANSEVKLYLNGFGILQDPISVAECGPEPKSICWVDYDNDGDADLFLVEHNAQWRLFQNNGDITNLSEITEEAGLIQEQYYFSFGQSWGDYDRDGDLDLYICNYHADTHSNTFYENNGDGTFTDISETTVANDHYRYSFQATFTDYNKDMWPDLFVINDRVQSPNGMYRNAMGSFSDVTELSGLDQHIYSMNNSWADYDRDGDLDVYVSNNPEGNLLMRQNGYQHFSNVAMSAGVDVLDMSWSAQWIDANNDGYEDLHVACSEFWLQEGQNRFFFNNQDGHFILDLESTLLTEDESNSHCTVVGDLNNDGYFEIFVQNDAPHPSKLYLCNPIDNNYVKVGLEGVISNREGIGSWIEVWQNGEEQMRYTTCGEGYLTQNSQREIFGIGQAQSVDSVLVKWPSGHIDVIHDVSANTTLQIVEGQSMTSSILHASNGFCQGDSLLLISPMGDVEWNTGVYSDSLYVTIEGQYGYTFTSELGLDAQSDWVYIEEYDPLSPIITVQSPNCAGSAEGSLIAFEFEEDSPATLILADTTITANVLENTLPGWYEFTAISENGCAQSFDVELLEAIPIATEFDFEPIPCFGESTQVELNTSGGTAPYNVEWINSDPEEVYAGNVQGIITDELGCTLEFSQMIEEPELLEFTVDVTHPIDMVNGSIVLDIVGGTSPYAVQWSGPEGYTGNGTSIDNLIPGVYVAQIEDANECSLIHTEVLQNTVGIETIDKDGFTLYPNPASGFVHLTFNSSSEKMIYIFDARGRIIFETTSTNTFLTIDTLGISSGQYFIKVASKHLVAIQSIIIE